MADACYEEGKITERKVESMTLAEAAEKFALIGIKDETLVELGLCSNARTVATVGRRLGWKPTGGEEAWRKGFRDDLQAVLAKQ